jgi:hypothetical protein
MLRAAGAEVTCVDLAVQPAEILDAALPGADLLAFYVPMHTATRLATTWIKRAHALDAGLHICCYGLYAPLNEPFLRSLGVATILGGEYEGGLVELYRRLASGSAYAAPTDQPEPRISLERQAFLPLERADLPGLEQYAFLRIGAERRTVGYTEASRGCKHLCRHCPIVPVYNGRFRVVPVEIVLADIRAQVAAGAEHITFGDPDFLNGPTHALRIVEALHREFPALTYDAIIKVEHLLKHAALLPTLKATGCLFITSAVEAVDDRILAIFDKRHTRADFARAVGLLREIGLALNPTFVTFSPWITRAGYVDLLHTIAELELIDVVAPIQYAIRLLLPEGSRLLELPDVAALVEPFDQTALCYPWAHPDPEMDRLHAAVLSLVSGPAARGLSRPELFMQILALAEGRELPAVQERRTRAGAGAAVRRPPVPQLSEPWYC